jgi:hypothetical protein
MQSVRHGPGSRCLAGNRGEVALGPKQFISVPDLHSGGQFQRGDAAAVFGGNDDSAHALGDQ